MPSIGMDDDGNFAIVWTTEGQNTSFFNSIQAQRYDRDGNRVGNEFTVNTVDNTSVNFNPMVALSHDGVMGVTWSNTIDPAYYTNTMLEVSVLAKVYDAQGSVLLDQFGVGGGVAQSIDFDSGDNFVVGYEHGGGLENTGGVGTEDVYAHEYQLYDSTGAVSGAELRGEIRVNSANFDPTAVNFWAGFQGGSQVALDSDGDLTAAYWGTGPDVSERDIDQLIELQLIDANAHGNTPDQLAALRLQLENRYGLLRGSTGVMFSQFDADPHADQAASTILSSDDIANNNRDGNNMRWLLTLDPNAISGGFSIRVSSGIDGGYVDVAIAPKYYSGGGKLDPYNTLKVIHDAIQSATSVLGLNWPQPSDASMYEGPVSVRLVSPGGGSVSQEMINRVGSDWDPANAGLDDTMTVYEIDFLGEVHDSSVYISMAPGDFDMKKKDPVTDEEIDAALPGFAVETYSNSGTLQWNPSIAMTSAGSFVMVWNEQSDGGTNMYFRTFKESTDTAGPLATDFLLPTNGDADVRLQNNATVTQELNYIVVTFDEDMMTTGSHSVTNVNNWSLLKDGNLVTGGISQIYYGLNEARHAVRNGGQQQVGSRDCVQRRRQQPKRHDLLAGRPLRAGGHQCPARQGRQRPGPHRLHPQRHNLQPFLRRGTGHGQRNRRQHHRRRSVHQPLR